MPDPTNNPTPADKVPNGISDELLSAYIDGELSADERATVDARLATDPAARQLVDELRAVSSTVGALPRDAAPSGFSAAVADRLSERKSLASRVFGTPRRWAWAAAAIAASLVIVAVSDRPGGDEALNVAKAPAAAAPAAVVTDGHEETLDAFVSEAEADESSPPPTAVLAASEPSLLSIGCEALVRVELRPDAYRERLFDGVLASNAIAIDPGPAPATVVSQLTAAGLAGRSDREGNEPGYRYHAESTDRGSVDETASVSSEVVLKRLLANSGVEEPPADRPVDVLLVDAAPDQIEACLWELNVESIRCPTIEVQPASRANVQQQQAERFYSAQQPRAEPWTAYNRSQSPPIPGDELTNRLRYGVQATRQALPNAPVARTKPPSEGVKLRTGRAYRLLGKAFKGRSSGAAFGGGGAFVDKVASADAAATASSVPSPNDPGTPRVQVLFVIQPEASPPSASIRE